MTSCTGKQAKIGRVISTFHKINNDWSLIRGMTTNLCRWRMMKASVSRFGWGISLTAWYREVAKSCSSAISVT